MPLSPHSPAVTVAAVAITTNASGAFSATTPALSGRVLQYRYVPDGTSPLDTGADLTIAGANTGIAVITALNIGTSAFQKAPRQPTHAISDASALLYAAGGTAVSDCVWIDEPLTVTIAQGGNTLKGTVYIWIA